MPSEREAVVIGAGPGGLSVAATLGLAGVDAVVLERAGTVGSAWRTHYERLHLHTVRWLSHLPGHPIPRRFGRWVSRDKVISYLEGYARHHRLDIRFDTTVERIEREDGRWRVCTDGGDVLAAYVVVATGHNHTPVIPDWPGLEGFTGDLVHSKDYRDGERYHGQDVLVV
ncbi:MAG: flavin-containing monooxygenase, partial [Acidimicrobiia bacterium]